MAMVCPQCRLAYDQRWQCPQCHVTLQYQINSGLPTSAEAKSGVGAWHCLLIGTLLSQGFFHAFKHLCSAGLIWMGEVEVSESWNSWTGLGVQQGLEAAAVLLAATLVGAGEKRAPFFGAAIGVFSGLLFVLTRSMFRQAELPISEIAETVSNLSMGFIGGLIGCTIWKPLFVPALEPAASKPKSDAAIRIQAACTGPVAWIRVVLGISLAVAGAVWANVLRELIVDFSEGRLQINSHLQAELMTWEITALAMLAGSGLAGATRNNGLKQGLMVGVGTATVLVGLRLASPQITLPLILITMLSALCLGVAGGWLGSQMLPPIVAARKRERELGGATF